MLANITGKKRRPLGSPFHAVSGLPANQARRRRMKPRPARPTPNRAVEAGSPMGVGSFCDIATLEAGIAERRAGIAELKVISS